MIKIHLKKVGWRIEWSVSWLAKKSGIATGEHGFLLLTMAHIFEAKGREVRPLEVEENKRVVGPWQILHGKRMKIWSYLKLSKYGLNMDTIVKCKPRNGSHKDLLVGC